MKITSVDIIQLNSGRSPVQGAPWHPTVVRINTDEGISGLGEVGLAYSHSRHSAVAAARDFAALVIGEDPTSSERLWERLYRDSFWGLGGGGFEFGGISGLDIALWDIRGKALGVPVYKLLGGNGDRKLRTYASQIQLDWGTECRPMVTPEQYGNAAKKAIDDGFDCVKVNPIFFAPDGSWANVRHTGMLEYDQLKIGVERVEAIRQAGGDDLDIIIELHSLTDVNTATQLGRELEQFRILYCEEPATPLSPVGMRDIAQNLKIPIAGGERIYGRWGYRPFLENGSIRVIQPDLGNCGGISEGKKICDMAHPYDVAVQLHVCGGPIATAAALQVEAAISNFLIHEHHAAALMQENVDLCEYDYQPEAGFFSIPDLPGIGQELSRSALKSADIFTVR
jgi:L-alanine-DL-glutamate epimerase-like enolase superfamily enzyme